MPKDDRAENIIPYQWEPGQSGNPKGKPKGAISKKTILRQVLDLEVDSESELITKLKARFPELFQDRNQKYTLETLISLRYVLRALTAERPDALLMDILDRMHGRPLQSLNLMTNADQGEEYTADEARERLEAIRRKRQEFENARIHVTDDADNEPGDDV